ncbi:hypothetical protein GLX27_001880 [Malassezia furfur]|uniref:Cytochrome b mRNA-processing protein 4 n=1 Tax=Malassezia furfur TaxID=55194 RepID=A0ABY8EQI9_MALFU|nr:hypothetical protein CBS14141_003455 [Malassezia furfur]WFD47229.1 hypothetical protein GLX27_001880 [Malassezia furfur]
MPGGARNWARAFTGSAVIIGIGVALLKYTVPNEKEMYDNLPPDLKRQVDAKRRVQTEAEFIKTMKEEHEELAKLQDSAKPKWV